MVPASTQTLVGKEEGVRRNKPVAIQFFSFPRASHTPPSEQLVDSLLEGSK